MRRPPPVSQERRTVERVRKVRLGEDDEEADRETEETELEIPTEALKGLATLQWLDMIWMELGIMISSRESSTSFIS